MTFNFLASPVTDDPLEDLIWSLVLKLPSGSFRVFFSGQVPLALPLTRTVFFLLSWMIQVQVSLPGPATVEPSSITLYLPFLGSGP